MIRLLIFLYSFTLTSTLNDTLPKGKVIDTVRVADGTHYSYALYIPPRYDTSKQWPVIFALDPRKRGYKPVTVFKSAAKKYGYIIAGSNDSQNGPLKNALPAIQDMIRDVVQRFQIDPKRIYVAGFSGGSRVASYLAFYNPGITGIVGCGAGLANGLKLSGNEHFSYVGTVGNTDMNYIEMKELQYSLNKFDIPNHQIVFNGGHQWPDSLSALQAIQWLQLDAMRRKLINTDTLFINHYQKEQMQLARNQQKAGNWLRAHHILTGLTKDLTPFHFVNEHSVSDELQFVDKSNIYQKQLHEYQKLERLEDRLMIEYVEALRKIMNTRFDKTDDLKTAQWWKSKVTEINRLKQSNNFLRKHLGSRLQQFLSAHIYEDHRMIEHYWRDYHRLVWMDEVGVILYPKSSHFRYLLARSYILDNQIDKGLMTLKKAMELGYTDYKNLETNPDFKSVSEMPVFKKLLERMK